MENVRFSSHRKSWRPYAQLMNSRGQRIMTARPDVSGGVWWTVTMDWLLPVQCAGVTASECNETPGNTNVCTETEKETSARRLKKKRLHGVWKINVCTEIVKYNICTEIETYNVCTETKKYNVCSETEKYNVYPEIKKHNVCTETENYNVCTEIKKCNVCTETEKYNFCKETEKIRLYGD